MENNPARKAALKILFQNKLYSLTDCNDLQRVIESNQFTIINYKKTSNSEYIAELIEKLRIEKEVEHNDSFLYLTKNLKILFINANVSVEDKCALLRHELGHISDPNFKNDDSNYSKIKREEFANEFAFCIKNPGIGFKLKLFIIKKWKLIFSMFALAAFILGLYFMINFLIIKQTKSVTTDISTSTTSDSTYYVTSSGKKYHKKHCIIIKYKNNLTEVTLNEAINARYKPCLICFPQEE